MRVKKLPKVKYLFSSVRIVTVETSTGMSFVFYSIVVLAACSILKLTMRLYKLTNLSCSLATFEFYRFCYSTDSNYENSREDTKRTCVLVYISINFSNYFYFISKGEELSVTNTTHCENNQIPSTLHLTHKAQSVITGIAYLCQLNTTNGLLFYASTRPYKVTIDWHILQYHPLIRNICIESI